MNNYSEILLPNETTLNDTASLYFAKKTSGGFSTFFFMGLIMFVTNLIVVISSGLLMKRGTKPKCPYLLLGNIALTELITGIVVMITWLYPSNPDGAFCSIYIGIKVTTSVVSFYSVALIALDRFLYIIHGLKYNTMVYPTRVRMMIGLAWLFGIAIGFLPVVIFAQKGRYCWYGGTIPKSLMIILNASGLFPNIFILVLYSIILYKAIKTGGKMQTVTSKDQMVVAQYDEHNRLRFSIVSRVSSISGSIDTTRTESIDVSQTDSSMNKEKWQSICSEAKRTSRPTNKGLSSKQWKAIKIVLFTAGNQLIIFTLYTACTIISLTCDREKDPFRCGQVDIEIARYVGLVGYAHHMFNPIIYYWWHNGFRNIVNKLFCK